jgi:DNA-binding transcriptional LysR family regulator
LYALINQGNCFSILPALAANLTGFAEFAYRPLKGPILYREIGLITRRLRSLAPSATRLVDSILSAIDHHKLPSGVKKIPRAL